MVTMLSQLTTDSWPMPLAGPIGTSVDRPRTVVVIGATVTCCPGSAAARGAGDAGAGRGLVDDPGHHAAQHGAEVDHVPDAAPGDQRGDAERAFLAVLPVDDPGPGDVPEI